MSDIPGTNVAAPIVPFTTDDPYPTHHDQYGCGGWRGVANTAEMNAIPQERRRDGMAVYVADSGLVYVYRANTASFVLFTNFSNFLSTLIFATWAELSGYAAANPTVQLMNGFAARVVNDGATHASLSGDFGANAGQTPNAGVYGYLEGTGWVRKANLETMDAAAASVQAALSEAAAAASAERAEQAKAAAAIVAATAPNIYTTTAAGLAAVAEGASFWVQGALYPIPYRKTDGAAVAIPFNFGDSQNFDFQDTGANSAPMSQRAFNILQPITVSAFTSLAAALNEASATGRTLRIDGGHNLTAALQTVLTGPLNIELTHRALFENNSLTPVHMLMRFILAGHSLRMEGADWEIALNDMAAFGLRIEHDSEIGRPDVFIGGARVYDSFVGPGFSGGTANNIGVVGNLNMVELQDVRAFGCRRSSNTAGPVNHAMDGVTQNIVIARTSFSKGPLHVRLRNVEAHDALTPDPQYANADNYALFQNFEAGATFLADDIRSYNGQGRGIKIQCGSAQAVVRNAYLFRNVQCITTNTGTGDLSAQYERGLFENIVIEYEGANVHNASLPNSRTGTTAILTYHSPGTNANGELNYGLGPCEIRNVDIRDRSTGGHRITIGTFGFSDDANHPPRQIVVDNVKVTGGLVKHGFELNSIGISKSVNATFNAVQARFDTRANGASFFLGNLDHRNMLATFTNCENLGTDELRMGKLYGGGYTDPGYGCFIDGGGNRGFYNSSGVVGGDAGLIDVPLTNFATAVRHSYSPITKVDAREIGLGATIGFRPLGDGYAQVGFKPRVVDGEAAMPGEYRVSGNSNAITVVQASPVITVGNAGVEPDPVGASRQVLLWWVASERRFYAKAFADGFFLTQIPMMAG